MSQSVSSSMSDSDGTPFRNLLILPDRLRYIVWTLLGRHSTFQCRLRSGPILSIRPAPSSDWETAYEIFRVRVYDTGLETERVRRIVDVGGNVGYSLVFWCLSYPHARILTYEPHPLHCEIIRWHLDANGLSDRVTVLQAGAAVKSSSEVLIDDGIQSRIMHEGDPKPRNRAELEIKTVDFFETVGTEPIDILKIDIEGGEYELLQDPRFDEVAGRSRCIVMEWHKRAPHHLGGKWCEHRISNLGFAVIVPPGTPSNADIGMIVAIRKQDAA